MSLFDKLADSANNVYDSVESTARDFGKATAGLAADTWDSMRSGAGAVVDTAASLPDYLDFNTGNIFQSDINIRGSVNVGPFEMDGNFDSHTQIGDGLSNTISLGEHVSIGGASGGNDNQNYYASPETPSDSGQVNHYWNGLTPPLPGDLVPGPLGFVPYQPVVEEGSNEHDSNYSDRNRAKDNDNCCDDRNAGRNDRHDGRNDHHDGRDGHYDARDGRYENRHEDDARHHDGNYSESHERGSRGDGCYEGMSPAEMAHQMEAMSQQIAQLSVILQQIMQNGGLSVSGEAGFSGGFPGGLEANASGGIQLDPMQAISQIAELAAKLAPLASAVAPALLALI